MDGALLGGEDDPVAATEEAVTAAGGVVVAVVEEDGVGDFDKSLDRPDVLAMKKLELCESSLFGAWRAKMVCKTTRHT